MAIAASNVLEFLFSGYAFHEMWLGFAAFEMKFFICNMEKLFIELKIYLLNQKKKRINFNKLGFSEVYWLLFMIW